MSLSAMAHKTNYLENIVYCGFLKGFEVPWTLEFMFLLFCFVMFLKQGSLCNSPGSHSVDQNVLKITEIHLPLAPEFWITRSAPSPSAAKTFDRSVYRYVLSY